MDSAIVSTTPPTRRAAEPQADAPAGESPAGDAGAVADSAPAHTGSLSQRMMLVAAGWITFLLLVGGVALDRTLTTLITRNFDEQLGFMLTGMIVSQLWGYLLVLAPHMKASTHTITGD